MLSLSVTIGLIGAIYGGTPVHYMRETLGYEAVLYSFAATGLVLALATYWIVPEIPPQPKRSILSDVKEVYAYFSMSEKDFLQFTSESTGKTIAEKIKGMPAVGLQLADKSLYPAKGRIELMEGQFDKNIGTIQFRAVFPNGEGLLRTGSTGKILIPKATGNTLAVPQQSTYELQDKVYVYVLGDSNKVVSQPITISGQTTSYYLVNKGVQPGQKIVFAGMDRLRDGAVIQPQVLPADSVRRAMPLEP